ncbi:MAG TPA: sterol desaturase family protein [Casimicrobiaceae bacterium]|nr:sterol desaturase family protein [Casimicrobiaceae bacterium]
MDAPLAVAAAYFGALVVGFAAVATWETVGAARAPRAPLRSRWTANLALLAVNHGVLPFLVPLSNAGAAWFAAGHGLGLFHAMEVPSLVAFTATLIILDGTRFALHRLFHQVPWLWRLHRVHHSDVDFDLTVGLRFHPVEALLVNAALVAVVLALGAPFWAVVASDALTIAHGLFAHGNVALPPAVDRVLRRLVVTPAMHTTHHSVERDEAGSNLGSVLPWWDHLFGTYRERPRAGEAIVFGLDDERDAGRLGIARLLALPFAARR